MTNQELLAEPGRGARGGGIRVVDLTQTLRPVDAGDPAAAAARALAAVPDRGDLALRRARSRLVLEQHLSCGEHTGTHFDAPAHWITGKDWPTATPTRSRRSS